MLKKVFGFFLLFFLLFFQVSAVSAQEFVPPKESYFKGEVIRILDEGERDVAEHLSFYQVLEVEVLEGEKKNERIRIENSGSPSQKEVKELSVGEKIVVLQVTDQNGESTYSVWDRYRLNFVIFAIAGFFILVVLIAGFKGIGSITGMAISLSVLMFFIVPQILSGRDPLLVSIAGALIIMVVTIYLAHGISKKTSVAVVSTFLSLIIVGILAMIFVKFMNLSGLGNEASYTLQFGVANINLQGLLLGGIIIGALGVLDDITTTQSAAVFEIKKTDKSLPFEELARRGFNVGKEHVTSLVNTLLLAYAGASLSLFILFELNPANTPTWVILNSEMIIEEIVRTLAGSIGLVLAVPITTLLAAYIATRKVKSS